MMQCSRIFWLVASMSVACKDDASKEELEEQPFDCPKPENLDETYQAPTWDRNLGSILNDLPAQWDGTIVPMYDNEGNETDEAYPFTISRGEIDTPYDESALRIKKRETEEECIYYYVLDSVYTFDSASIFELELEISTSLYPENDELLWLGSEMFANVSQTDSGSLLRPFSQGDGSSDDFHERNWEALVISSNERQLIDGPLLGDISIRHQVPARPLLKPEDPDIEFEYASHFIATFEVSVAE